MLCHSRPARQVGVIRCRGQRSQSAKLDGDVTRLYNYVTDQQARNAEVEGRAMQRSSRAQKTEKRRRGSETTVS